jgi:hypothetical protein
MQEFQLTFRYLRRLTPLKAVGLAATRLGSADVSQLLLPESSSGTEERQRRCVNMVLDDCTATFDLLTNISLILLNHDIYNLVKYRLANLYVYDLSTLL